MATKKKTKKIGAPKKRTVEKNAKAKLFIELVNALESEIDLKSDAKLITTIASKKKEDGTRSMINNWKTGGSTGTKAAEAFVKCAAKALFERAYQIIVELEPIKVSEETEKCKPKELMFLEKNDEIRKLLENNQGIYIFYDSLGKAIYAGKTEKNTLWLEMKSAYNRERSSQKKFRRTSGIKIAKKPYYLHEVAEYVSVYSVRPYAIGFIEALLIHSFPNDLTNVRVEKNGKLKFEDKIKKEQKSKSNTKK